jgi:hypothetical protein
VYLDPGFLEASGFSLVALPTSVALKPVFDLKQPKRKDPVKKVRGNVRSHSNKIILITGVITTA